MDGDSFLDVLQQGQYLEDLTLDGFMSAACSEYPSRYRQPFSLPRLSDIVLVDEERWLRHFMAFVHAPRPRELVLTGDSDTADLDNASTSPQAILPATDVPLFPDTGVRIHAQDAAAMVAFNFWLRRDDMLCTFFNYYVPVPEVALDFSPTVAVLMNMAALEGSPLCILDLKVPMRDLKRDTLDAFLDAVPHLRWLHIGCGRDARHPLPAYIFDSLATRSEDPDVDSMDPDAMVRCPKLTYLGLGGLDWDGGAVMDAALDCLQIRAALDLRQLEHLAIRVRPRAPVGEAEGGWGPVDARYAAQLQEMVSHQFSFGVGPERGVY